MKAIAKLPLVILILLGLFSCSKSSTDCLTYKGTSAYKAGGKVTHNYKNRKNATPERRAPAF